jgi:hypothetical protein
MFPSICSKSDAVPFLDFLPQDGDSDEGQNFVGNSTNDKFLIAPDCARKCLVCFFPLKAR